MFKLIRLMAIAGLAALTASPLPTSAGLVTAMVTKPITSSFVFVGFDVKVLSIQTVNAIDSRPFIAKMNDCGGNGYIMVLLSMQNNSSSETLGIPSLQLQFELADGSDLNGPQGDGVFLYPGYASVPQEFHPKDHRQVLFVSCNWNGQAITKMFLTNNGGGGDSGYNNVRFLIPRGYVTAATPAR